MALIHVETRSKNLPDSGAWHIHKFGSASGEQRIALEGSWMIDKNLFDFYLKDVEFYFFTKSDMLDYISSIHDEIYNPTQKYKYKNYPTFFEDKKKEILKYPSNIMVTHFEANPRSGGTAYLASVSSEDSLMYNFLRSICLSSKKAGKNNAYTTFFFIKYQDTKTGKFYINLVPKFTKKYNMKELSVILKHSLQEANDIHVAVSLFGLKYADMIVFGGYSCQDLITAAGYEDKDLVDELALAVRMLQHLKENEITINPISNKLELLGEYIESHSSESLNQGDPETSRQLILYGAPGTSKSHEMKRQTEGQSVIRTTFHPDSDYSTFVGAYKPSMNKENKIVYTFVKQAFLKAYLKAWQKMCLGGVVSNNHITFEYNATYSIDKVDGDSVDYRKTQPFQKKKVHKVWMNLWKDGEFVIEPGPKSGRSIEEAISLWIRECIGIDVVTVDDFEKGWQKLIETLKGGQTVRAEKTQSYDLLYKDDEWILINTKGTAWKDAILKCYNGNGRGDVQKGIAKLLKDFHALTFEDAWNRLVETSKKSKASITFDSIVEEQYLLIEEINRGNCAQIFGDLFQLLDRSENGFSAYHIEADTDIQKAIADAFAEEDEFKLANDINVDSFFPNYQSNYAATISEDIQKGRVLVLPPNLYIWATMNTSDQSLFPIDSAFKRRWDWRYMKIKNMQQNYTIYAGAQKYDWWAFIEKMNKHIYSATNSEDKQMGYFFVHKDDGQISADLFAGKVLFYLYNDALKDYSIPLNVKNDKGAYEQARFSDFYDEMGKVIEEKVKEALDDYLEDTATTVATQEVQEETIDDAQ